MVEELDSRLKRCPCCRGETVLGSLYGCRPWVTYWLPRYRSLLSPFFSRRNIEKSGGFLLAKGREYWSVSYTHLPHRGRGGAPGAGTIKRRDAEC